MKSRMHNKQTGFTLIEIIIVVVILGILAAVALPKLTANIGKSSTTEAFNIGGQVAKAFDRCVTESSGAGTPTGTDTANCNTWSKMGMVTPATNLFDYTIGETGTVLWFTAKGKINGLTATDIVNFTYSATSGQMAKSCAGIISGMCK